MTKIKTKSRPRSTAAPSAHHLDRRVDQILAAAGDNDSDALMHTHEVAAFLGMSVEWIEIGRTKNRNYGPPFVRIGRAVRYRRDALIRWLDERARATMRKKRIAA